MPPKHATSAGSAPRATIGRYEVQRVIGAGAMGRVLLAHDPVLGRDVAIKLLRDDLRIPEDVRQGLIIRMRHEARAAARVAHPNLVTLHDMGEDDEIGLYLVFEYVEGPTLKQRLVEGRLAPRQAARLARELGAALSFAHTAGILHRDIKPENIILSTTGGKIADFGIARIPDSTLTHAGGLLGTPAYSAPETFKSGSFSPESDQFSLAASLYEAVYGRRAFPGDEAVAVASRISSGPPDRLSESTGLPANVDEVLARAMAPLPADRFPSCEVFGRALAGALLLRAPIESDAPPTHVEGHETPTLLDPQGSFGDRPPPERKSGQVLLGAAVVLVTAVLLARAAMRTTEPEPSTDATALDASATAAPSAAPAPPRAKPHAPAAPKKTPPPSDTASSSDLDASAAEVMPEDSLSAASDAGAPAAPATSPAATATSPAATATSPAANVPASTTTVIDAGAAPPSISAPDASTAP